MIAKVHVDCWQTTYQGLLPKEYIQKRSYEKRLRNWQKKLDIDARAKANYFIYVAEVAGEVVGFINGGLTRGDSEIYTGEIYALYILQSYQRRGISISSSLAAISHKDFAQPLLIL
ncbi:MAG: GNAT family N-acetyltransferase [Cyanobacteria bacterium P01_G01_bin.39]